MQIDLGTTPEASYSRCESADRTSRRSWGHFSFCSPLAGSCGLTLLNWGSLHTSFAFIVAQRCGVNCPQFTTVSPSLGVRTRLEHTKAFFQRVQNRLTDFVFTAGEKDRHLHPGITEGRTGTPGQAHSGISDFCPVLSFESQLSTSSSEWRCEIKCLGAWALELAPSLFTMYLLCGLQQSSLSSLWLSFFICKMGKVMVSISHICYKDKKNEVWGKYLEHIENIHKC